MSDTLARIRAAHEARKASAEKTKVHVPEWGVDLYFAEPTLNDHEAIKRGVPKNDEAAMIVSGLMHLAMDKDGKRVFDVPLKEKPDTIAFLRDQPLELMQRIVFESAGGLPVSLVDEIVAADADALRVALAGAVADQPTLSEAVQAVPDVVLQMALTEIAKAHDESQTPKNS